MRDPARLDNFYLELAKIHKENFPDWRFAQFISNIWGTLEQDPWYFEENKMLEAINKSVRKLKGEI